MFRGEKPTVARFQKYLDTLAEQKAEEWKPASRVDAAEATNFWKRKLKVQFLYRSRKCNLKSKDRGRSGFQLREPGKEQTPIYYTGPRFPRLRLRKRKA